MHDRFRPRYDLLYKAMVYVRSVEVPSHSASPQLRHGVRSDPEYLLRVYRTRAVLEVVHHYTSGHMWVVDQGREPVSGPLDEHISAELLDENSDGLVTTRTEWDRASRRVALVEDDEEVTRHIHDGANRVVETRDALGNREPIAYDQNSNPVSVVSGVQKSLWASNQITPSDPSWKPPTPLTPPTAVLQFPPRTIGRRPWPRPAAARAAIRRWASKPRLVSQG